MNHPQNPPLRAPRRIPRGPGGGASLAGIIPHSALWPTRPLGTRLAGALLAAIPVGLLGSCGESSAVQSLQHPDEASAAAAAPAEQDLPRVKEMHFDVSPPPFTEGVFPCTDCHDPELPVRTDRRPMQTAHEDIVFDHDEENRWCLDCHSAEDRDMLHLASGELVPFEESYRLCGQCHGDKYRDWRAGVHGRRTGSWNGEKHYLLCVNCHNAHSPKFAPIPPKPSPTPPRRTP